MPTPRSSGPAARWRPWPSGSAPGCCWCRSPTASSPFCRLYLAAAWATPSPSSPTRSRSFFSVERTRALLAGKREGAGTVAAASLGIVTPFCSCSAVPLFIGFVSAGVPLGVTFNFLVAAPMVNEVALGLLFGLVGWQVALTYLVFGLGVAIVSGWVIGRLHLEGWLEDWVRNVRSGTVQI